MAMAMAVSPALLVSTTVPDAFSAATDIAVSRESGILDSKTWT